MEGWTWRPAAIAAGLTDSTTSPFQRHSERESRLSLCCHHRKGGSQGRAVKTSIEPAAEVYYMRMLVSDELEESQGKRNYCIG